MNISGTGEPERVLAAMASKEFPPVLGIHPIVGRNFLPEEDRPGGPPAVIISHALWQRRFHSDPSAVGQTLTVNGIPRTIVGVVPHEVSDMVAADLWLPTAINPNGNERRSHNYGIVARLNPGITVEQARAEMVMIAQCMEQQYPATNSGWGVRLFPMAEMYNENPLGQRLITGRAPREIVGVVADEKLYGLDAPVEPAIYAVHTQQPNTDRGLVLRTQGDSAALTAAVRNEILKLDPEQPISEVRTMDKVLSDSLMLRRVSMLMISVFAGLALVLATVGIYGLTAYSVSQRTHEIGLRTALGANQLQILRLLVGRGLIISLIGAAFGVAAAFQLTRFLGGMLFGVTATDPRVFVSAPLLLIGVSLVASDVPARKATQIDPLEALRHE